MSNLSDFVKGMNQRKVKVFVVFLLCSFLAWSISKLSGTYESRTTFDIVYQNVPDTLIFKKDVSKEIRAKIRASGFQFLTYSLNPKDIVLDLKGVLEQDGDYFVTANSLKNQMEGQLPKSVSLLELDDPIHYTGLYRVDNKWVPIVPKISLQLAQNHLLNGKLKVTPDSIKIKGPGKYIEAIEKVETVDFEIKEVTNDFSQNVGLKPLDSLGNVQSDIKSVTVSGVVVRFSEKEFVVTLKAQNVPEGYRLRMFPDKVRLVCKAGLDRLKTLQPTDFELQVDYNAVVDDKFLFVEIGAEPEEAFSVRLLQNRIEFVLEKI